MRQQGPERAEHLLCVEADERIGAQQRVQRGMVFLGSLNFRLPLGCNVHVVPPDERSRAADCSPSLTVQGRARTSAAPTGQYLPITDRAACRVDAASG